MSIELPETKILSEQMNKALQGKRIKTYHLKDYERLQRIGFLNKDINSFNMLVNGGIRSIISRGNAILIKLDNEVNLLLNPEYGGKIFYHIDDATISDKFHLKIDFSDDTALTVRLTSMGGIHVLKNGDLKHSYIFQRDFNPNLLSPLDEEFNFPLFSELMDSNNRMLKSVLVGKEAIMVGLSNSAFQDIIFRARLHPKRKAASLSVDERLALYNAIKLVIDERVRLNGKDQFFDLYGDQGNYTSTMGPNMKQKPCSECGTTIEKLSVGGGQVYFCPKCQR